MTSAMIRQNSDGKRYYMPLGKFGTIYDVPDDRTSRLVQGRWKIFFIVLFGGMISLVLYSDGDWRLLIIAPFAGLLSLPFGLWAARGLPKSSIRYADLTPQTYAEAQKAYSVATGRRTLGAVLIVSALMAGLSIFAAVTSGQRSLWLGAGFFLFCTWSIYRAYRRASTQ